MVTPRRLMLSAAGAGTKLEASRQQFKSHAAKSSWGQPCLSPSVTPAEGARRLDSGFSKLYQASLLKQMKAAMRLKNQRYPKLELDKLNYENVTSLAEFDDQVTAPLHGYTSGQDYYDRASTLSDLRNLETRTHIIFACNDPFFSKRCIPADDSSLSADLTFELVERAGHVAFISGNIPFLGRAWLRGWVAELILEQISR